MIWNDKFKYENYNLKSLWPTKLLINQKIQFFVNSRLLKLSSIVTSINDAAFILSWFLIELDFYVLQFELCFI